VFLVSFVNPYRLLSGLYINLVLDIELALITDKKYYFYFWTSRFAKHSCDIIFHIEKKLYLTNCLLLKCIAKGNAFIFAEFIDSKTTRPMLMKVSEIVLRVIRKV